MTTATTDQDFADAVARGISLRELSDRFGVSTRSIYRWKRRLAPSAPSLPRQPPSANKERARALLAEGMLPSWITEETGLGPRAVTRIGKEIEGHTANLAEWRSAWGAMRKHPELVALHNELKPKKVAR